MPTLGILSSVNLIAGAGILGNVGGVPISANTELLSNISSYQSVNVVSQFANVATSGYITVNVVANTFPSLTNAIPTDYQSSLGNGTMTGLISSQASTLMGSGDLGKFQAILSGSIAYVIQNNQLIKSALNANKADVTASFVSSDNVITGGLSNLTQAFRALGEDLTRLGFLIDLDNLGNLGSPGALLIQMATVAYPVPAVSTALLNAGLSPDIVENLSSAVFTPADEKRAYQAMTTITGSDLQQVLEILKITTPGISTMADLLNPVKIFPISFNTLITPTKVGLRGIYINDQGAVNSSLESLLPDSVLVPLDGYQYTNATTYSELRQIIPADQALANKAIQAALEQVDTIFNASLPGLSATVIDLENNQGLSGINSLTAPLPANVSAWYANTFATGSGIDGLFLLTDFLGTPSGVYTIDIGNTISILTDLTAAGAFSNLTNGNNGVYTVMANTIAGDYTSSTEVDPGPPPVYDFTVTIPAGLPGAGTYGPYASEAQAISAAFVNLEANMISNVNNVVSSYANAVSQANNNWANIAAQIEFENVNIDLAQIDIANLTPNVKPFSLVYGLPQYGLDTAEGGAAFVMESVSNIATLGGQAIVSTMRESRNRVRLNASGLGNDMTVSDIVDEPQAELSSGQYTVSQAVNNKII